MVHLVDVKNELHKLQRRGGDEDFSFSAHSKITLNKKN